MVDGVRLLNLGRLYACLFSQQILVHGGEHIIPAMHLLGLLAEEP